MKQQKLTGYRPNYPKKALRGAAMTAAALMAVSGAAGCGRAKGPDLEGLVPMPVPTEQELIVDGEVGIPEATEEPALMGKIMVTEPPEEELVLDGDVVIVEPPAEEPTPEVPLRTTGVLLMPTATPDV